jgi:hypothetical protein
VLPPEEDGLHLDPTVASAVQEARHTNGKEDVKVLLVDTKVATQVAVGFLPFPKVSAPILSNPSSCSSS